MGEMTRYSCKSQKRNLVFRNFVANSRVTFCFLFVIFVSILRKSLESYILSA